MTNIMCFFVPRDPGRALYYLAMYQVMAASARRAGVDGKFHFVTYETTRLPRDLYVDSVLRIPVSVAPVNYVHLLRIYGWLRYVQSDFFDAPTITVDTDVLFQRNPAHAFADSFDIGLTYECISKIDYESIGKINSGVMFLNPKNKVAVIRFFEAAVRKIEEIQDQEDVRFKWGDRHPTLKEWGGDETALMEMFPQGELASPGQEPKFIKHGQTVIKTFPSVPWNCQLSAQEENGQAAMPYNEDAVIRHFPGNRKLSFFKYAEKYLGIELRDDDRSDLGVSVYPATLLAR